MLLTKDQAGVAWNAINYTGKKQNAATMSGHPVQIPEARNFPIAQLKDSSHIAKELTSKCSKDNAIVEGDISLDLDQKKLLKTCLEREWSAQEGEHVLSLQELLNQS